MRVAILCNGPSRVDFKSSLGYTYIIGCNIPWTKVDSTVVMDVNILQKMKDPYSLFVSRKAWIECPNKVKDKLIGYIRGLFDPLPEYDTAGHVACRKVLELGATEVDIYGCDSWWDDTTESYTHKYSDSRSSDMNNHIIVWRTRWKELMDKNPQVQFNFIGEPK